MCRMPGKARTELIRVFPIRVFSLGAFWRIGMAVGSASAFVLLFVMLWPQAHSAGEVLLSQDDPSLLSDVQLSFALQNDPALI